MLYQSYQTSPPIFGKEVRLMPHFLEPKILQNILRAAVAELSFRLSLSPKN